MTRSKSLTRRGNLQLIVERIKQALAYGRVRTVLQAKEETIHVQQVRLRSDIGARDNPARPDRLQLAGEFWDNGVSGAIPLEKRPEGRKLVNLVCANGDIECRGQEAKLGELSCAGKVDIVIDELWITKLDRLGRTLQILIDIERFLSGHGVALISLDFGINTSTHTGRLIFAILGAIAQWERETIHERTTGGRYDKAAQGKFTGGRTPYGMTVDEDGFLHVDEELIKVVEEIFENIGRGVTAWAEGIRTGLGEARIRSIVHNRKYKGEGGLLAGGERWIAAAEGKTPMVIPPHKWQLAQDKLIDNSKNADRNRHFDYLLTGEGVRVLTCLEPFGEGVCGRTFAGRAEGRHGYQEKYVYYYCSRSREDPEHTAKMLRGRDLEDAVWAEVEAVLRDPGKYLEEARKAHNADGVVRQLRGELSGAIEKLGKLAAEREVVNRNEEKGVRTEAEADARRKEIDDQVAPLEALRAALEVQLRSAATTVADDARARVVTADLLETLDEISATDDRAKKRELIKAVVKRAEVRTVDGQAEIRLLLRVGAEVGIVRGSGQGASDNAHKHGPAEPIVVTRTLCLQPKRRGPRPGSVRRPDTAQRNAARSGRLSSSPAV
jgi:site-specific DNA recombinase